MNQFLEPTNVLKPFSLSIKYTNCYYCGSEDYHDMVVSQGFGIRHCTEHTQWAKRDCNAHLYTKGRINVEDVMEHSKITDFIGSLSLPTHIIRSSGLRENGWVFRDRWSFDDPVFFIKNESEWSVPMICASLNLFKQVLFSNIPIDQTNSHLTNDMIQSVVTILNSNTYKKDYQDHMDLLKAKESKVYL
jgi:hypothetical protein